MSKVELMLGDCLELMKTLPDGSVDSIVTDPPYGLSFMGKRWDYDVPGVAVWRECLRVLKPGGHLLSFGGSRTYHRLAVAIEDAGFEVRDQIMWLYSQGFPKSHDVSKGIDKAAGAEREKVLVPTKPGNTRGDRGISYAGKSFSGFTDIGEPATEAARQWQGWGTALKPAHEPIVMARKPLIGTVVANVLAHGTGAINVDGCRVEVESADLAAMKGRSGASTANKVFGAGIGTPTGWEPPENGRWPANVIHDGSDEVVAGFPNDNARFFKNINWSDEEWLGQNLDLWHADTAEGHSLHPNAPACIAVVHAVNSVLPEGQCCVPSWKELSIPVTATELRRIFESVIEQTMTSVEKFSPEWRRIKLSPSLNPAVTAVNLTPTGITQITISRWRSNGSADPVMFSIMRKSSEVGEKDFGRYMGGKFKYCAKPGKAERGEGNNHPTVKPLKLMAYLCRLVTPTGGVILDPFMGSGSTGNAALREGFSFKGMEMDQGYFEIARNRIKEAQDAIKKDVSS